MNFTSFKEFLIEAELYDDFVAECKLLHTEKVTWDMLQSVPKSFCTDHYTYYLDGILQTLDKKKTTLFIHKQSLNADFLVYIKWLLFFLKRGKDRYYEKEINAIKADEKKGFEESEKKKNLDIKSKYFDEKYKKLVSGLTAYEKPDASEVTPDLTVSIYREIASLYGWKKEVHPVRPSITEIAAIQPVLIEDVQASDKKTVKGIMAVKDIITDIPDRFKTKESQNPYGLSKEEIEHAGLLDFQKQEISEYLQIMNLLFIVCSRKYFYEDNQ